MRLVSRIWVGADFEPTRLGLFHLCFMVEEGLGRFLEGMFNYIRPPVLDRPVIVRSEGLYNEAKLS